MALIFFNALLLISWLTPSAWAVSEAEFEKAIPEITRNYEKGEVGNLSAAGGKKINYRIHSVPNEKGAIVVVNGRGESHYKYAELILDLNRAGYSVYSYDHRGQGFSEGRLPGELSKRTHVGDFQNYVDDLDLFVTQVVKSKPHPSLHLLSHSLGSVVASRYLQQHPDSGFNSAALTASAFGFNQKPIPDFVARMKLCGLKDTDFARGGEDSFDPNLSFEGNKYTSSEVRFRFARERMAKHPIGPNDGPTNRFACEMMKAGSAAVDEASKIDIPVYVGIADNDKDARVKDQQDFCKNAKKCTAEVIAGKHELLMEKDEARQKLLQSVLASFQKHSPKPSSTATPATMDQEAESPSQCPSRQIGNTSFRTHG